MSHNYHDLLPGVFMGSASDTQDAVDHEDIQLVVDLRSEATKCAATARGLKWVQVPLGDNSPVAEAPLFKEAITQVADAYQRGQKVYFHCGLGRGRTGTVAAGVLLELGLATDVDDAIAKAKLARPEISVQPVQRQALLELYSRQ